MILFSLTLCATVILSNALNFNGVEERFHCDSFPIQKGVQGIRTTLRYGGMKKSAPWYVPMWNKVEYYHNALSFFGEDAFKRLNHKYLDDNSCTTYAENGTSVIFSGFGRRTVEYRAFPDPLREGIYYWGAPDSLGFYQYVATSYTTFSDGTNFVVTICLWNDGRKGFTVSSVHPELQSEDRVKIEDHLTKLGFNPEHFVYYDYSRCKST